MREHTPIEGAERPGRGARVGLRRLAAAYPLRFAWGWVIIATLWIAAMTPLLAQEAYYWSYSRHLALSYFDHPPMVAWGIRAGNEILGLHPFAIRMMTVLWALGTVFLGDRLLRAFDATDRTRTIWLLFSLAVPILGGSHFLANPDAPLTFFWTLCVYSLWRARDGGFGWWLLTGLAAGGALLSKYTAAFLGLGGVIVLLWDPVLRRRWRTPGPWIALGVAAACFSPVLVWNAENDWASFLFQTQHRYHKGGFAIAKLLRFLVEQTLLLAPFMACFLPVVLWWCWRRARRDDAAAKWLLAFGAPLLAYMVTNAAYVKAKPNWLMPIAVPLSIATLLWAQHTGFEDRRPRVAATIKFAMAVSMLALMALPSVNYFPSGKGTSWTGWPEVVERVDHWLGVAQGRSADPSLVFVFAPDYRDSSQLAYQLACRRSSDSPAVPVLAQNTYGEAALQYDLWTEPDRHIGSTAVLVLTRPEGRERVVERTARRFERIERVESVSVRRLGNVVVRADLYMCTGYRGPGSG